MRPSRYEQAALPLSYRALASIAHGETLRKRKPRQRELTGLCVTGFELTHAIAATSLSLCLALWLWLSAGRVANPEKHRGIRTHIIHVAAAVSAMPTSAYREPPEYQQVGL